VAYLCLASGRGTRLNMAPIQGANVCSFKDPGMKYRKKPVVIDAVQWLGELGPIHDLGAGYTLVDGALSIETLEGKLRCNRGDWVIKGIVGELYTCRDAIFRATYEAVEA